MTTRWYPQKIWAGKFAGWYNRRSVKFLFSDSCSLAGKDKSTVAIAEIGVWQGGTSYQFARFLGGQGQLHLFDYDDIVSQASANLRAAGFSNVTAWGSTYKYLDSYNWSLMKLLEKHDEPLFDYIFLDGAHTVAIDALTFFLCDRLLKPRGYLDFDDYNWRLRHSSLDPGRVPETALLYTDEQIDAKQVRMIVDTLVKRDDSYTEVMANKIFQKISVTRASD